MPDAALAVVAVVAGLVSGAVGSGGVLLIAALYLLTAYAPAEVAGTASAVFVVGSVAGSGAYARSDDLALGPALVLGATSVVGARAGTVMNAAVSEATFAVALGGVMTWAGGFIAYQRFAEFGAADAAGGATWPHPALLVALGLATGALGGLVGVGGPVLAVPALVLLGVPIRRAVAAAMVQACFITVSVTASYAAAGSVQYAAVGALVVPFVLGMVGGWRVAHRVSGETLKIVLAAVLVVLGPYVALG